MDPGGSVTGSHDPVLSSLRLCAFARGLRSHLPCEPLARGDLVPVELLAVAAEAEVFEEGFRRKLELSPVVGLVVDPDLELPLEVDQPGAEPDVKLLDPDGLQVDEIAQVARPHLDRGRAQVLAEHLDGLGGGGPARAMLP